MMNYRVKYSIATYCLKNQKENIAVLGVYDINHNASLEEKVLDFKKNFDEEIIIESSLGGGAGFPLVEKSTSLINKNHEDKLNEYINNIKEDTIVMLTDKDIYELIPIYLLSLYAKKANKRIICLRVGVCKFESKRAHSNFSYLWDKIKEQANEAILIDCNVDNEVKCSTTISQFELFLFNKLLIKLHSLITK